MTRCETLRVGDRPNTVVCFVRFAVTFAILLAASPGFAQGSAAGYRQGGGGGGMGGGGMGGFGGGGMGGGMQGGPNSQPNARPDDDDTPGLWQARTAILTPGDRVEYKFEMAAGETIFAAVSSDAFDPALSIEDAKGKELAKNDDRVEGDQSPFLIYRTGAAGTLTLKVLSYRSVSGGKFTVKFRTFRSEHAGFGPELHTDMTPVTMPGGNRIVFRIAAKKGMYYDLGFLNGGDGYTVSKPAATKSPPAHRIVVNPDESGPVVLNDSPSPAIHQDEKPLQKPAQPVHFDGTDIRDALSAIFKEAGVTYEVDPRVQGRVTLMMKNASIEDCLNAILGQVGALWQTEGGVDHIYPVLSAKPDPLAPAAIDEAKYIEFGARFIDIVGPTGAPFSDFESVPTADGTIVFLAKTDGDFYVEYGTGYPKKVGTEFREFAATPTTASSEQVFNFQPRELRVIEFPVKKDQIIRTTVTGSQFSSLVSETVGSAGSLATLVSITPPADRGRPGDISELVIPSIDCQDTDVREVLRALFKVAGVSYEIDPRVQGVVTLSLRNVRFDAALRDVLDLVKATWRVEGGVYQMIKREEAGSVAAGTAEGLGSSTGYLSHVEDLNPSVGAGYGTNSDWSWFKTNIDFDTDVIRVFKTPSTVRLVIRSTGRKDESITVKNDDVLPVWDPGKEQAGSIEIGDSRLYLLNSTKSELMKVAAQAKNFQLKMEIFRMSGDVANTLMKRRSHTVGDNLYFPDAAPFIVRISCDGNGGSGEFGIRRDVVDPVAYSLGRTITMKLGGSDFGLFSVDLVAGKRYELVTDRPMRIDLLDDDGDFLPSQEVSLDKVQVRYFVPTKSGRHRLWLRGMSGTYRFKLEANVPPSLDK